MDFLTVRKKLDGGDYTALEQFEVCFASLLFANMDIMFICLSTLEQGGQDMPIKFLTALFSMVIKFLLIFSGFIWLIYVFS